MNRIDHVNRNSPLPMASARSVHRDLPQPAVAAGADKVELTAAQPLAQAFKAGEIRQDKVAALRKQLEAGTYDEDAKLDVVVDKILDELTR